MIQIFLRDLMDQKAAQEGRRVTIKEISEATGISRQALTKIADHGSNVETGSLDKLCAYFSCRIEQLIEYRPDAESAKPSQAKSKTVTTPAVKKKSVAKKASN